MINLLHSERPKLDAILAFLTAIGLIDKFSIRCENFPILVMKIKVYANNLVFSAVFTNGNTFCDCLFASPHDIALQTYGLPLAKKKSSFQFDNQ